MSNISTTFNCNYCDYCNYCNYCDYCDYCNSCNSCNYCDYCNYCNYSKNLKMSENQLFCVAEKYGSDYTDSYQQKRFRIFNVEVTKEEYEKVTIPKIKLDFDKNENYKTRYQTAFQKAWAGLSSDQKQKFLELPHFNSDIFFKITGVDVKIQSEVILTIAEIEKKLGIKNLKIVK